jgi:hypothetical protein
MNEGWIDLIADAVAEAERAIVKFPQPNYVITKFAEEAGEVVKDAVHCAEGRQTYTALRQEMKQTIAMMYRLWIEGEGAWTFACVRNARGGKVMEPTEEKKLIAEVRK